MISAIESQIPSLNCPYAKHEIICRGVIRSLASQKVEPIEREKRQSGEDKDLRSRKHLLESLECEENR